MKTLNNKEWEIYVKPDGNWQKKEKRKSFLFNVFLIAFLIIGIALNIILWILILQ